MLSKIFQMDHYSSHLLNRPVLPLYNPILFRSNGGWKFLLNAIW